MPCLRISLTALFILFAAACTSESEPTDLSDPGFLPTGTYDLRIVAASCNVNNLFQDGERAPLFRNAPGKPPGVNIPLPTRSPDSNDSPFGMLRQDVDLTKRHLEFDFEEDEACRPITTSVDLTELSAKRITVVYRETPAEDCHRTACSVE